MEAEIAKLLNLNVNDTSKLGDVVTEYFANPWEENFESDNSDDDGSSMDYDEEFDPRLSGYDLVMQNDPVIQEYATCTGENFDQLEWEKAAKFR